MSWLVDAMAEGRFAPFALQWLLPLALVDTGSSSVDTAVMPTHAFMHTCMQLLVWWKCNMHVALAV